MTTPASLGNAAKFNSRLLAICNHCAHTVELNLQKLITKHGRDYPVRALKPRLRSRFRGRYSFI